MKRKLLNALLLILLTSAGLFAQEKKSVEQTENLVFTESKILDQHYKVVYFCLSEVRDADHQQQIRQALSDLPEVKKVRIYTDLNQDKRCQMTVYRDVTPTDIQATLKENQTDFLFVSVKKVPFK